MGKTSLRLVSFASLTNLSHEGQKKFAIGMECQVLCRINYELMLMKIDFFRLFRLFGCCQSRTKVEKLLPQVFDVIYIEQKKVFIQSDNIMRTYASLKLSSLNTLWWQHEISHSRTADSFRSLSAVSFRLTASPPSINWISKEVLYFFSGCLVFFLIITININEPIWILWRHWWCDGDGAERRIWRHQKKSKETIKTSSIALKVELFLKLLTIMFNVAFKRNIVGKVTSRDTKSFLMLKSKFFQSFLSY